MSAPRFLVLCLLVFAAPSLTAQEPSGTLKKIKESNAITLGYREAAEPFSWLNEQMRPIGYSIDLCAAIVEEVKRELGLSSVQVTEVPVTSTTGPALIANESIDLECGNTVNTLTRQRQVAFSPITFFNVTRWISKKNAKLKALKDLRNRSLILLQGGALESMIKTRSATDKLGIKLVKAKDLNEAVTLIEEGKADAFVAEELTLLNALAKAKKPKDLEMAVETLAIEPIGITYRTNDSAFGLVVTRALALLMRTGEMEKIYDKWFVGKRPAGSTIGLPMNAPLKSAFQIQALPE